MVDREDGHLWSTHCKEELLINLMNQYGQQIARLAYTYVKQKQVAEDIAQDVFIKCYQSLDQFRGEASYKTWLYQITANTCKDRLKSWSYRNILFMERIPFKHNSISTEELYLRQDKDNEIVVAVMKLPVKYREVIILRYYEDLSIREIAILLGINLNTIKSRLKRAHQLLNKVLKGVHDFE